jgi:hypothetical protein
MPERPLYFGYSSEQTGVANETVRRVPERGTLGVSTFGEFRSELFTPLDAGLLKSTNKPLGTAT